MTLPLSPGSKSPRAVDGTSGNSISSWLWVSLLPFSRSMSKAFICAGNRRKNAEGSQTASGPGGKDVAQRNSRLPRNNLLQLMQRLTRSSYVMSIQPQWSRCGSSAWLSQRSYCAPDYYTPFRLSKLFGAPQKPDKLEELDTWQLMVQAGLVRQVSSS